MSTVCEGRRKKVALRRKAGRKPAEYTTVYQAEVLVRDG